MSDSKKSRKRASKPAGKPAPPPAAPPAAPPADPPAPPPLSCVAGMKYMLATFGHLFELDAVALAKAFTLIERAEKDKTLPRRIEIPDFSDPVLWYERYADLRKMFGRRGGVVTGGYTARQRGERGEGLERVG